MTVSYHQVIEHGIREMVEASLPFGAAETSIITLQS
jgi:hypothetical protein